MFLCHSCVAHRAPRVMQHLRESTLLNPSAPVIGAWRLTRTKPNCGPDSASPGVFFICGTIGMLVPKHGVVVSDAWKQYESPSTSTVAAPSSSSAAWPWSALRAWPLAALHAYSAEPVSVLEQRLRRRQTLLAQLRRRRLTTMSTAGLARAPAVNGAAVGVPAPALATTAGFTIPAPVGASTPTAPLALSHHHHPTQAPVSTISWTSLVPAAPPAVPPAAAAPPTTVIAVPHNS